MTPKRVVTYLRVSTKHHGQNLDTQRLTLQDYARNRGFEIVEEYADHGFSGAKDKRPALNRLMKAARARKFDILLVARFDRFARSTRHLVTALEEFAALGIDFISLSEAIDTSTPAGKLIFTIMSGMAEFERSLIKERISMGLDRTRKEKRFSAGCVGSSIERKRLHFRRKANRYARSQPPSRSARIPFGPPWSQQ